MAYNGNIPLATDAISNSQPQILENFQVLEPFGNGYADFPVQGAAPTFSAGHTGLYNLNNATTSAHETYLNKISVDAPTAVPMSASKMSNTAMASCVNGWGYLPNGLLVKWGKVAATVSPVSITPTVTSGGPNFNQVFQTFLTPFDTSGLANFTCGQATANSAVSGNFTAYCNNPSGTTFITYLVIGV